VRSRFLVADGNGHYTLKLGFQTQREVERNFASLESNALNARLKEGLYDLISNVVLFTDATSPQEQYHFRFGMETTSSFKKLDAHAQWQLRDLYVDYFFRRQDGFWMQKAMRKLPALKRATRMLVCGEDLGMVPSCVPEVMKQLGS